MSCGAEFRCRGASETGRREGAAPAKKDTKAAPAKRETKAKATKADQKAAVEAIAASYTAIPLSERIAIQNDLVWTGDYNGIDQRRVRRARDRRREGVPEAQRRPRKPACSISRSAPRSRRCREAEAGQRRLAHGAGSGTGARLGIPAKLVPSTQVSGGIALGVFAWRISGRDLPHPQPGTDARPVFERMKSEPAGRKTEYSVLRPDFFVDLGPAEPEEVLRAGAAARRRGARLHGDVRPGDGRHHGAGGGRDVERLCGVSGRARRRRRAARWNTPAASRSVPATSWPAAKRSRVHVVTVAGIGGADRVAEDKDKRACAAARPWRAAQAVALAARKSKRRRDAGRRCGSAGARRRQCGERREGACDRDARLDPAPAVGFDGARRGRRAGPARRHRIAEDADRRGRGAVPVPSATLTPVETVRNFLGGQNVAPAAAVASGVEAAKGSVVRVICVRK